MEKSLRYIGLGILAGAAWLLLAGELGWVDPQTSNAWFGRLFQLGGVCFLAGLALRVIAPGLRWVRRGRCVRCGAPTGRGQTYCLDHLRATVNEARDHAHNVWGPPGSRRRRG